jgi:hypothetical protein
MKVKNAHATTMREKGRHQMLPNKAAAAWIVAQIAPIKRLAMGLRIQANRCSGVARQCLASRARKRAEGPKKLDGAGQWPVPSTACLAFRNDRRRGFALADVLCTASDAQKRQQGGYR